MWAPLLSLNESSEVGLPLLGHRRLVQTRNDGVYWREPLLSMDKFAVIEIAKDLLAAIQVLAGYPVPEQLPEIHLIPQFVIAELVCKSPCRVQAFYHPDFGVLVDEKLNFAHDVYAQSILLHELVHHDQQISGRFETLPTECHRRSAAESEAYEVQNKFLAQRGVPHRIPIGRFTLQCNDR